jgi:SAM-dependent methyltransferase
VDLRGLLEGEFEAFHHSNMLNDSKRLDAYRRAIEAVVRADDHVVDIGCGTGVLTAYAAERTTGAVIGIEYFRETFEIAATAFRASSYDNVSLRHASSFDVVVNAPTVVVTETIGQLGPEENIVELLYDFVRRHPSVRAVIPSSLSVKLQFGKSEIIARKRAALLAPFRRHYTPGFSLQNCFDAASNEVSARPFYDILRDFEASSDEFEIVAYRLGVDRVSAFEQRILVPKGATVVAMYFLAELSAGVSLSSRPGEETHWGNMHYFVPEGASSLVLSYGGDGAPVKLDWCF